MSGSHKISSMEKTNYLTNLLGVFATSLTTRMDHQIADLGGRSLNHDSALVVIHNRPNESIDILSKVLHLTHSGAVRLVKTLENESWIERSRNMDDGRSVSLCLTKKGKKRVAEILDARARVIDDILETLDDGQRKSLEQILIKALGDVTDNRQEARRLCRYCDEKVCHSRGCPIDQSFARG